MHTRRVFLAAVGVAASSCASAPIFMELTDPRPPEADLPEFAAIERRIGGRLGVCAISTSGAIIGHRATERFAMASTFKWLLAAAVLKRHETDLSALDATEISFRESDLLDYAPVTRAAFRENGRDVGGARIARMSLARLCEAAITVSDNTAANLLLDYIGGPSALTAFFASCAGGATRLDRMEPALNENAPGDPRDTTTPFDMAWALEDILLSGRLFADREPRNFLLGWLNSATTGLDRLRAGLPPGWQGGDKTGTGGNGAYNDVGIVFRPAAGDIVIASYISESSAPDADKAAAHADVMRIVARELRY